MRKTIYIFLTLLNFVNCSTAQDKEIQSHINSIFDKMEFQGVDTKKPLLYGYFFYDKDKLKLVKLKDELLKDKYKLVRLELTEKQEYILQVEKLAATVTDKTWTAKQQNISLTIFPTY